METWLNEKMAAAGIWTTLMYKDHPVLFGVVVLGGFVLLVAAVGLLIEWLQARESSWKRALRGEGPPPPSILK